jgi:hypothetical protein
MESTHPSDASILAFWSWFRSIADELADDFENQDLLDALDGRISELGDLAWELGPGSVAENVLAISPDGERELLPLTQRIVSLAPEIPHWELLPARPPRSPSLELSITDSAGRELQIDAHAWRYVLFRFRDGMCDLVLEQNDLKHVSEGDRYTVATLVLDGLLGEQMRLLRIQDVEPVVTLPREQAKKASPITDLAAHLRSLSKPDS